ncbi:MAG: hypothetical protein FWF52_04245 [Candidatus Azobacteroides sp.]|nr:hypothetical protein [Candidatus Azobacteroides sp.]
MKVTVINSFVDKDTGRFQSIGEEAEYTEERAKELIEKGFVKAEEEVKTEAKKDGRNG